MRSATPSPTGARLDIWRYFGLVKARSDQHRVQINCAGGQSGAVGPTPARPGHCAGGQSGRRTPLAGAPGGVLDPGGGVGYQGLHHVGEVAADDRGERDGLQNRALVGA
jgi:hypothetical protein